MVDAGFPRGGGDLGALIRAADWASSPLGPVAAWPACIRAAVELMLPASAQIVMFCGPDFVALYNDAYAPTIGDNHPRALGRPARENWAELWTDLAPLLEHVRDRGETVSARSRPFHIERHGHPERVHFDISYSPVRDEAGVVQAVFCIVNETTEQVRALAALRENEERLGAIFQQASAGIAQGDAEGRITLVNQRYCEITGYDEAELIGRPMLAITHADDVPRNRALFRRLMEEGAPFTIEKRYVRKDGSLVWVSNAVGPIRDAEGRVRQAVATVTDISDRRRVEEVERRLAAIIASSDDAILSTDLAMRITSWNRGAERLYGYTAAEVTGASVMILVPEDRRDEEVRIFDQVRRGERVAPHETLRLHRDGRAISVSLSVSPVVDLHGEIIGASKIARDITERKEVERLQRILMAELQHRVKNLLATVQAIARQTFGGEPEEESAAAAFNARLHAIARAYDLLIREDWDGARLTAIVDEVIAPYERDRFTVRGPELRAPPRMALALSMALHELATNAAKYGALSVPAGRVAIEWEVEPGANPRLELTWRESGGPPVRPPARKGFGSRLIETALAMELRGQSRIEYRPEGIVCAVKASLETA